MVYGAEFEAEPHETDAQVLALYRDVHSHGKKIQLTEHKLRIETTGFLTWKLRVVTQLTYTQSNPYRPPSCVAAAITLCKPRCHIGIKTILHLAYES